MHTKLRLNLALILLLSAVFALVSGCSGTKSDKRIPAPSRQHQPAPKMDSTKPSPDISWNEPSKATQITWYDSERLMPVLEHAKSINKPVFVEFHASWCAPCKVMEEEVFTQALVYQYLNDHFFCFRTDFDSPSGRTIAEIYEVEKLPTLLFLSPNGVVLERYLGMLTPSTLVQTGNAALQKMGK